MEPQYLKVMAKYFCGKHTVFNFTAIDLVTRLYDFSVTKVLYKRSIQYNCMCVI